MRNVFQLVCRTLSPVSSLRNGHVAAFGLRPCRQFTASQSSGVRLSTACLAWRTTQGPADVISRGFSNTKLRRQNEPPSRNPAKATDVSSTIEGNTRQLTWRDYDPEGGMPLEEGDLSSKKLDEIFSSSIDPETGNWIVRLMNWRRHSGSLIDQGINFDKSLGISEEQAYAALQYLRRTSPDFDENKAGIAWAEEQIQELSAPYIARAEKLGLYKPIESDEPDDQPANVYGESQLIAMKRANEARFQEEERLRLEKEQADEAAALAAAQASSTSTNSLSPGATSRATLARRDRAAWVKHYEQLATLSSSPEPPKLSLATRLGPSALATLLVLLFSFALHELYVTPPDSARMFPNVSAGTATLAALVAAQLLVFVAYRFPPLWRAGNKFLLVVPAAPRAAGVVLATFTHTQFAHLFWNAVLLCAFGRFLHEDVERGTLLAVFLATGTAANFASLATHVLRKSWSVYSYGSSTAVYGVLTAACLLRADHDVKFFGYHIPMTGLLFLGVFAGLDLLAFFRGGAVGAAINFSGHLAGFVGGALCAMGIRWERSNAVGNEAEEVDQEMKR